MIEWRKSPDITFKKLDKILSIRSIFKNKLWYWTCKSLKSKKKNIPCSLKLHQGLKRKTPCPLKITPPSPRKLFADFRHPKTASARQYELNMITRDEFPWYWKNLGKMETKWCFDDCSIFLLCCIFWIIGYEKIDNCFSYKVDMNDFRI